MGIQHLKRFAQIKVVNNYGGLFLFHPIRKPHAYFGEEHD